MGKGYKKDTVTIQSSIMYKSRTPFKVHNRFYFNPKTKKYMSDKEVKNFKNKHK